MSTDWIDIDSMDDFYNPFGHYYWFNVRYIFDPCCHISNLFALFLLLGFVGVVVVIWTIIISSKKILKRNVS